MGSSPTLSPSNDGHQQPLAGPDRDRAAMFGRGGDPVAHSYDHHQSSPTLPKMMSSPERHSSFSHLVLPPIRNAGPGEALSETALPLSSHLVLPSINTLPGPTMTHRGLADLHQRSSFSSFSAVGQRTGATSYPGTRPYSSLGGAGSLTHLEDYIPPHHHQGRQLNDTRHDVNPFAFSDSGNVSRLRLQDSDRGTTTSPLRIYAGLGSEPSNIRDLRSSKLSPRGYESVSAPPTAMQDGSPRNVIIPQRETYHPPSRPIHEFAPQKRSVTDLRGSDVASASSQHRRPRTSYDGQGSRSSEYAFYHPPDAQSYHSTVTHSLQLPTSAYSPALTTDGSGTFESLPNHRDLQPGTSLTVPPSEHDYEQGMVVELERRCEEIATNCLEILQNLEGTEDSRQQRKRRMVRASHEIVDQLQDLAYYGTWPREPPGPAQNPQMAQPSGMHTSSDFPSTLDVVARLERTNPEAAAQAARDMAAIRARTHGTFPNPPVEDSRKEREK